MKRWRRRAISLTVLVGAALSLLQGGAAADHLVIELTAPEEATLGESLQITAAVYWAEDGEPADGIPITFFTDAAFAGVIGDVELGTVTTNEIGVATFPVSFLVSRQHTIRAEAVAQPGAEPESVTVPVLATRQLVTSEAGIRIPGIGGWLLVVLIGSVWAIMIFAAFRVVVVSRAHEEGRGVSDALAEGRREGWASRHHFNLAVLVAGIMIVLSLGLLVLLVRSPDTHANLNPEGYDRTVVAYTNASYLYPGPGLAAGSFTGDLVEDGRLLFVSKGCAGCHGLEAEGAVAAASPALVSRDWLGDVVRSGIRGLMPSYSEVEVNEPGLDAIYAFFEEARQALEAESPATTVGEPEATAPLAAPEEHPTPTYTDDVAPIFRAQCVVCHGDAGGWSAADYQSVMTSGDHGPTVVPGRPEESLLAQKILGTQTEGALMPPGGRLSDQDIHTIVDWILGGAPE